MTPLKQAVEALRDAYHIRKWSKEPISKAGVEATPEEIEEVLKDYFDQVDKTAFKEGYNAALKDNNIYSEGL